MRMSQVMFFVLSLFFFADSSGGEAGKKLVYVSFYPLESIVRQLAGSDVEIVNLSKGDPVSFVPRRELIWNIQDRADLVLVNGVHYEQWLDKVTLPEEVLVATAKSIADADLLMSSDDDRGHGHGGAVFHLHSGINGHFWMDPRLLLLMVDLVGEAMIRLLPERKESLLLNKQRMVERIEAIDRSWTRVTLGFEEGAWLLENHPTFDYWARRYGLKVKSFPLDPDIQPSPATVLELSGFIKGKKIHYLIWEKKPRVEVERFYKKEFQLDSLFIDPGELTPMQRREYLDIVEDNIDRVDRRLRADQ